MQQVQERKESEAGRARPAPGARERRKQRLSASLERIAVDLALEHGVDSVTIEDICERALISSRTFYNYFASKETALFGTGPQLNDQSCAAFRSATSRDVVGDLLEMLSALAPVDAAQDLFRDRRRLLRKDPSLITRAVPKLDVFQAQLTDLTLERLESMGRSGPLEALRDEAAMIVALASAVMQRAFHAQLETDQDTDPRAVVDHSIALARRILAEGRK